MAEHSFVSTPAPSAPAPRPVGRPTGTARSGSNHRAAQASAVVTVRAWTDSAASNGHDVSSRYVERFWLGVLGPTATWLLRRLNDELAAAGTESTRVDLSELAGQMGLAYTPGRSSAFAKGIQRCVMFSVAHHTADGLAVRRRVPTVAERHLRRLPPAVAADHSAWLDRMARPAARSRAERLGEAMIDAGDDVDRLESQLVAIGVHPADAEATADEWRQRLRPSTQAAGGSNPRASSISNRVPKPVAPLE